MIKSVGALLSWLQWMRSDCKSNLGDVVQLRDAGLGVSRYWMMHLFVDDLPDDWRNRLNQLDLDWICSPLHDKDVSDSGRLISPHYNLFVFSARKISADSLRSMFTYISEDIAPLPMHTSRLFVDYERAMCEQFGYDFNQVTTKGYDMKEDFSWL